MMAAQRADRIGIVLAAGQGTRMGMPKALLRVGSGLLSERHAQRLLEAGCEAVVIVTHPDAAAALSALFSALPVQVVAADTRSPAESIATAMLALEAARPAALAAPHTVLIVTPVDLLPAATETIDTLVTAVESSHGRIDAASPSYRGKGGHPVALRPAVLRGRPLRALRDHLQALGARRIRVLVDDAAVVGDFDLPTDVPSG